MRKEKFKTVLLTILFVLSIILTQQLWISIPLAEVLTTSKQVENKDIHKNDNIKTLISIVSPQSFIVNFGGGLHTVLYSDTFSMGQEDFEGFWPETLMLFKDNYFQEGATVEEVAKEKWEEVYKSKSILMDFGLSIPLSVVRNLSEGKEAGIAGKIQELDSILIGATEGTGVFLSNTATDKYYRLKGISNKISNFPKAISLIDQNSYNIYYDIKDVYGNVVSSSNVVESHRLIPVSLKDNIPTIQVVEEIDPYNEAQVEAYSSTFFGESFDFVRKITETNGSVIYMYGYGKKVLKIDTTGALEYFEEIDPEKSTGNLQYWDALKEAYSFVKEHGGWPNNTYLKEVNISEDNKRKGYEFVFGYRINSMPVYYNDKLSHRPIVVVVEGKQIIHYERYIKNEKVAVNFLEEEDLNNTTVLTPLQVIDSNFDKIKQKYLRSISKEDNYPSEENVGNEVLKSIRLIKLGYYDNPMRERNKLIPVWVVQFDLYTYYFDAYSGTIVYQSEI